MSEEKSITKELFLEAIEEFCEELHNPESDKSIQDVKESIAQRSSESSGHIIKTIEKSRLERNFYRGCIEDIAKTVGHDYNFDIDVYNNPENAIEEQQRFLDELKNQINK